MKLKESSLLDGHATQRKIGDIRMGMATITTLSVWDIHDGT